MLRHVAVRRAAVQIQGVLSTSGRNQNLANFVFLFFIKVQSTGKLKESYKTYIFEKRLRRYRTASDANPDVLHRIYRGVLTLKMSVFHCNTLNVISRAVIKKYGLSCADFHDTEDAELICWSKFHHTWK
jgi:hypothetical protein